MSQLIAQLSDYQKSDINNIITIIRREFLNFAQMDPQEQDSFQKIVFDFLREQPHIKNERNELIRFLMAIAILYQIPKSEYFSSVKITSADPFLTSALVIISSKCEPQKRSQEYQNFLYNLLTDIGRGTSKTFYSPNSCFFAFHLTSALKVEKQVNHDRLFSEFIKSSLHLIKEHLNINELRVLTMLMHIIIESLLECPQPADIGIFLDAIDKIFEVCEMCPAAMMIHAFHHWFFFAKSLKSVTPEISMRFASQMKVIGEAVENLSLEKNHELHHHFQWALFFYLYWFCTDRATKARIMVFICQGLQTVKQIQSYNHVCITVRNFNNDITDQYTKGDSWSLYFMVTSIETHLREIIKDLKKITGIAYIHNLPKEKEGKIRKTSITFERQAFNAKPGVLSKELTTSINEIMTNSLQIANSLFEKQVDIFAKVKDHIVGINPFMEGFCRILIESIIGANQTHHNSLFYAVQMTKIWTRFCLISTHRTVTVQNYQREYEISNLVCPKRPVSSPATVTKVPEFSVVYNAITEILRLVPERVSYIIGQAAGEIILEGILENIITQNFVNNFIVPLFKDGYVFNHIIKELYAFIQRNIQLILSPDRKEAMKLLTVMRFAFRFCFTPDGFAPIIAHISRESQKLIVSGVFSNTKRISHIDIAFRLLNIDIMFHTYSHDYNEFPHAVVRIKPIIFDEIKPSMRVSIYEPMIDILTYDCESAMLTPFTNLFLGIFKTGNANLINRAAAIFVKLLTVELPTGTIDPNNPKQRELFKAFFDCSYMFTGNTSAAVSDIITRIAPFFVSPPIEVNERSGIHLDINVDILTFCQALSNNIVMSEQDGISLINTVGYLFTQLETHFDDVENAEKVTYILITLFLQCTSFTQYQEKIHSLASHLVQFYGDLLADGISTVGFIAFILEASMMKTVHTSFAYRIAQGILEHASKRKYNELVIYTLPDDMISKFNHNRGFCILLGLNIYSQYFIEYIKFEHIESLLAATETVHPLDVEFPKLLNNLLKRYNDCLNDEGKIEFAKELYNMLGKVSTAYRYTLIKRIRKLGIMEDDVESNNHINLENTTEFQQFAAKLSCSMPIAEEEIPKIIEYMQGRQDNLSIPEKLSRKMVLSWCLLRTPNFSSAGSGRNSVGSTILNFLCNTLTSRYPLIHHSAAKAFKKIAIHSENSGPCLQTIDEYCQNPEKIFSFFGRTPDRISFYTRLTKIFPERIPPNVINLFFRAAFDFMKLPEQGQLSNAQNFYHILKQFSVKDYVYRDAVRANILEKIKNSSRLEKLVRRLLILLSSNSISFNVFIMEPFTQLMALFPEHGVHVFLFPKKVDSTHAFTVLTKLIKMDKTDNLFHAFTRMLISIEVPSKCAPAMMMTIYNISKEKKYLEDEEFHKAVGNIFSKLQQSFKDLNDPHENAFITLELVAKAALNFIKNEPRYEDIIKFSSLFCLPLFYRTRLYHRFIELSFKKTPKDFSTNIIHRILSEQPEITDTQFGIIISHAITNASFIPSYTISSIWRRIIQENEQTPKAPYIRCAITLYKKESGECDCGTSLVEMLTRCLVGPETQAALYALKLADIMLTKSKLPPSVFFGIASLILSYSRFLDDPFEPVSVRFLTRGQHILKKPTEQFVRMNSYYTYDKLTTNRDATKMISTFTQMPFLIPLLPFQPLRSFSSFLRAKVDKAEILDLDEMYNSALSLCKVTSPCTEDLQDFARACFEYLKRLFYTENTIASEFCRQYFRYTSIIHPELFPRDLMPIAKETTFTMNHVSFICGCARAASDILSDCSDLIVEALKFNGGSCLGENYINAAVVDYEGLITYIIRNKTDFLLKACIKIATDGTQLMTDCCRDKGIRLAGMVVKMLPEDERGGYLLALWENQTKIEQNKEYKHHTAALFYRFLVSSIEELPFAEQESYITWVVDNVSDRPRASYLLQITPYILKSIKVSDEAKLTLLSRIPAIIASDVVHYIEAIYLEAQKLFGKSEEYRIHIYEICITATTFIKQSEKIKLAQELFKLIPNHDERLDFLLELSPHIWNDNYLPMMIALSYEAESSAACVASMSGSLVGIGDQLAQSRFIEYIRARDSIGKLCTLITSVVVLPCTNMHRKVLNALLDAMQATRVTVDSYFITKAIKITGRSDLVFPLVSAECINTRDFVTMQPLDSFYSKVRPELSSWEAASAVFTMINRPEAALAHEQITGSQSYEIFREVAHHYLIPEYTPSEMIRILSKPGSKATEINEQLEDWLTADKLDKKRKTARIGVIKESVSSMITRKPFIFQADRGLIVSRLLLLNKFGSTKKMAVNPDDERITQCVHPSIISALDYIITSKQTKQIEIDVGDENEPFFFFVGPNTAKSFNKFAGFSSHGLIAVGQRAIEEVIEDLTRVAAGGNSPSSEWMRFAPFVFNLYAIQPCEDMFRTAMGTYSSAISTLQLLPRMQQIEVLCRIITLLKVSKDSNRELFDWAVGDLRVLEPKNSSEWHLFGSILSSMASDSEIAATVFPLMVSTYLDTAPFMRISTNPQFEELIQKSEVAMMGIRIAERADSFFERVFELDHHSAERQKRVVCLLQAMASSNCPYRVIRSTANDCPTNSIERAMCNLFPEDFKLLSNVAALQKAAHTSEDLVAVAKELTKSDFSLAEYENAMAQLTFEYNSSWQISRLTSNGLIYAISRNVKYVSPDIVVLYITSSEGSMMPMLVERVPDFTIDQETQVSLSPIMRSVFSKCYSMRTRGMCGRSICSPKVLTNHFITTFLPETPVTLLEAVSRMNGGMPTPKDNCQTSLRDFIILRGDISDYMRLRSSFCDEVAMSGVIRSLLKIGYPMPDRTILLPMHGSIPFVSSDLAVCQRDGEESSFRVSPNIACLISDPETAIAELTTPIAAICDTLISCFDSTCAMIEVSNLEGCVEIGEVVKKRDEEIELLKKLAPPVGETASQEDAEMWIETIEAFISEAMDTERQPVAALPWL